MSQAKRERIHFHNKTESVKLNLRLKELLRIQNLLTAARLQINFLCGHYTLSTRVSSNRKHSYPGANMKSKRSQLLPLLTIDYFKDSSDYIQSQCQKGSCFFKQNASMALHLVQAPVLYQTMVESKQNDFSELLASF